MTDALRSSAYVGRVNHRRSRPVEHQLEYRVFSLLIDLDELDDLDAKLTFFSRGKFNLFSFHDRDYGTGAPANIAAHIRKSLSEHGIAANGRIALLCYPRILGYAFNPLAIYYCRDASEKLVAILYEVRNTFGAKHSYLIPVVDGETGVIRQHADKVFHVSPFLDMAMQYHFRLSPPAEKISVAIRETDREGPILHASFHGDRRALSDGALLKLFFTYPLMTLKVIVGIHFEALRLIAKGLKLRPGDPTPAHPITLALPPARKRTSAA